MSVDHTEKLLSHFGSVAGAREFIAIQYPTVELTRLDKDGIEVSGLNGERMTHILLDAWTLSKAAGAPVTFKPSWGTQDLYGDQEEIIIDAKADEYRHSNFFRKMEELGVKI